MRIVQIFVFLLIVFLVASNLLWLNLLLVLPLLFYGAIRAKYFLRANFRRSHSTLYYVIVALVAFGSTIVVRLFVMEVYTVPTSSMQNTLKPGDRILVNKLAYGPKLPTTLFDIPWVSVFLFLNDNIKERADQYRWNNKRLTGYSSIRHGDIVVFNYPANLEQFLVKRCVAKPGDTVKILNGILYVNSQQEIRSPKLMIRYALKYSNRRKALELLNRSHIPFSPGMQEGFFNCVLLNLDVDTKQRLSNSEWVDDIIEMPTQVDSVPRAYPWSDRLLWTEDNFGPVVIPKRGMKIAMTEHNYLIYEKLLERNEGKEGNQDCLGDIERKSTYIFRKDYFFMMGDNRNDSRDSRFWGFVPADHIIGKATMVLFSSNNNGLEWRRTCKLL